jgi:hypothetical protein
MPVPLFIKAPHQHEGAVDDLNVETVDILPTLADMLGVRLPWPVDGYSVLNTLLKRQEKSFFSLTHMTKRLVFDPAELTANRFAEKRSLTATERAVQTGLCPNLLGLRVDDIVMEEKTDAHVSIDQERLFAAVDPKAGFVPAHITGSIHSKQRAAEASFSLAVAINGTIRAVTRTWKFSVKGETGKWSAIVPEEAFREGRNEVEAFIVSTCNKEHPVLARVTGSLDPAPQSVKQRGVSIRSPQGTPVSVTPDALEGWLDRVTIKNDRVELAGWAADLKNSELPSAIWIYVNEQFFYAGQLNLNRPDVVHYFRNPALQRSGFLYTFPRALFKDGANINVRAFAVSQSGLVAELKYPTVYQWEKESQPSLIRR